MLHSRLVHSNVIGLSAAFQDAEGIYLILVTPAIHAAGLARR